MDDFHEHLNRQNAPLQFSKEIEENGKTDFLDSLVTRVKKDYELQFTQYTQTDRLLDQSSFNPSCHKAKYDYTEFDETGATTLRLYRKLTRRGWLPKQRFL